MLEDYIVAKARTGSREICNPAPTDTDEDYIVLVDDIHDQDLDRALRVEGFYFASGDGYPESEFHSYRKGDLNYILTDNAEFFDRFVAATQLAKKYNLLEKSDRIQMFHAILEGEFISDEESQSRAGKKAKANSRIQGQTFTYIDELTDVPESSITIPWPETFIETVAYANSVTANNYRHNLTPRQALERAWTTSRSSVGQAVSQGQEGSECETCNGVGSIDERLGGYSFSNPEAPCPDCRSDVYASPSIPF